LTPEGWVFLIVLGFITVGAVLRNVNLLIVMAGMMYAPLLLNWRLGIRRLKSLGATRRIPKQLHANELISIQWTCENRMSGVAAWNVIIEDRIERAPEAEQTLRSLDSDQEGKTGNWILSWLSNVINRIRRKTTIVSHSGAKLGFVRVNAGQSEVRAYRAYFGQRGKYMIGPAAISTTFPFGLIRSRTRYPKIQTVYVAPQLGKVEPSWEKRIQSTATGSDAIKRRRALEEDEFYALRPWRSGDTKRNIHWRTTARFGHPIVKQYDQQNNRDFALALDLFTNDQDPSLADRCEKALSFAATVVLQVGNAVQGQVAVGICGRETEISHSRTPLGIVANVMKLLSVAHASNAPEIEETLIKLSACVSRGTPIYVVSPRARPENLIPDNAPSMSSQPTGDREADRKSRKIRQVLPLVRWLTVESEEFDKMFTSEQDPAQAGSLSRLCTKWAANVKR
jgi:uncharacterized protein (DUF58 family)